MEVAGVKRHFSSTEDTSPTPAAAEFAQSRPKRKLHGREFYESLGSPKRVVAPMVDRSEFAWRMLTRSFLPLQSQKTVLAYTPMLHARLFTETTRYRNDHFQPTRAGLESQPPPATIEPYLDGNSAVDRPLFVQFCANNPEELLNAARYVEPYCDAVDLNLGCPQGIARKGHYGAFLQEDWDLIYKLINTLHTSLSIPVTAKMRILETREKTLDYAKMILSAGASIITVHGRQRDQKGHNTGLADWSVLRYLRENLSRETVIFANGNILNFGDLDKCLEETGADAVMSAEGNLSDPTIFAEPPVGDTSRLYWVGRNGKGGYRMDAVLRRYFDILYEYVLGVKPPHRELLFALGEAASDGTPSADEVTSSPARLSDAEPPWKKQKNGKDQRTLSPNLISVQGHLFALLRPLVSKHHHIRDTLARTRAGNMAGFEEVLRLVEEVVREGILEYEKDPSKFDDPAIFQEIENDSRDDTGNAIKKYKRPWWVCQPYIRPSPKEAIEKGSMTLSKKKSSIT